MIAIRPITTFDPARFVALVGGYTTAERYRVEAREEDALTEFRLVLEPLPETEPQLFQFTYHDDELAHYAALAGGPLALGAAAGRVTSSRSPASSMPDSTTMPPTVVTGLPGRVLPPPPRRGGSISRLPIPITAPPPSRPNTAG